MAPKKLYYYYYYYYTSTTTTISLEFTPPAPSRACLLKHKMAINQKLTRVK
jgi:hypothetical protein